MKIRAVLQEPFEHTYAAPVEDTYRVVLREHSGYVAWKDKLLYWLQVKAWAFLQRRALVASYSEPRREVRYKTVELDVNKLSQQLLRHTYVLRSIFNYQCDTIIIGRDVLDALEMELRYNMSFTIRVDTPPTLHNGYAKFSLAGMRVICIPWFEGALAVDSKEWGGR